MSAKAKTALTVGVLALGAAMTAGIVRVTAGDDHSRWTKRLARRLGLELLPVTREQRKAYGRSKRSAR